MLTLAAQTPAPAPGAAHPIALTEVVAPGDPLAVQDLTFDATFAQQALAYLQTENPAILAELTQSPAAEHLLRHARNFDYDVPKESASALVNSLLVPASQHRDRAAACQQAVNYFDGPMAQHPQWVNETLRYLPHGFRFHGALYLTYGYDIGVAFGNTASLNCAHKHFEDHPSELIYYAIHELHHVGFNSYQPPPRLADLKTCADLLRLVKYSTQMEGMAVWAAYRLRSEQHALADDADYVALSDPDRMQQLEASYWREFHYLEKRATQPADAEAWAVIDRMSGGERLWYRVGAHMAQTIERQVGLPALVELVKKGPESFLETYTKIAK